MLKTTECIRTDSEEKRLNELRLLRAEYYEKYISGSLRADEFRRNNEKLQAEAASLESQLHRKKLLSAQSCELQKRIGWFLEHSRGALTRQMAEEIINSVSVVRTGVTVLFREEL